MKNTGLTRLKISQFWRPAGARVLSGMAGSPMLRTISQRQIVMTTSETIPAIAALRLFRIPNLSLTGEQGESIHRPAPGSRIDHDGGGGARTVLLARLLARAHPW